MLTGLLFGQESAIVLKDGKTIKGTIVSEEEYEYTVQVVKVYGYSRYEKIKILKSDIVTIESEIDTTEEKNKGINIDIPTEMEPFDFNSNILPTNFVSKQEIINMSDEEKGLLYGNYKVSPLGNTVINFFVPTLGYHRINQWKQRGPSCIYIYLGFGMALQLTVGLSDHTINAHKDPNANNILDSFAGIFTALHFFDVYTQTKKYNKNLSISIFGQKTPPSTLGTIFPLKTNYIHYFNFFGVPNHRTGIGMFGYSITKRTKKNNEYYMGIGTAIINLSITAGWKYYFKKSNADDYYLAMSLVGSTLEIDDRYDETKKVSKDFIAGNFSAGYEKRLSKNIYLNMEIFTLAGIMPNSEGITDGIRYLVAPSFHFNYRN
tara:strand:- start:87 stop:1214 length:1128 start_codon:yes stop_codon:yes gene_type:complete